MKPIEAIPSKRWRNKKTGAIASLYGAVPWTTPAEKADWEVETVGWTVRNDNGTIGIGREPWKTKEEADAYVASRG